MVNFLTRFFLLLGLGLLLPLDAYAQYAFPYGRCYDRACESSPYRFTWINTTRIISANQTEWCFDVSTVSCVNSPYKCCSSLSENLKKIVIQTRSICDKSVAQVTVNGIVKRGGIYFDTYTANNSELRITSLSDIRVPPSDSVPPIMRLRFCLTLKSPCQDPTTFCSRNNGPCKIAAWETTKHECCPTCTIAMTSPIPTPVSPPPSPPPHSPPPPSPPQPSPPPHSPPPPSPDPPIQPPPSIPAQPGVEILPRMQFQNCTCTCY